MKTLLLNADYTPIVHYPKCIIRWEDAFVMVYRGIATVLEEYEEEIGHPSLKGIRKPATIVLNEYHHVPRTIMLTKDNLMIRDAYTCQITGERCHKDELSIDHVVPRSKGGKNDWENLITTKKGINAAKADRLLSELGLELIRKPTKPTYYDMINAASEILDFDKLPKTWKTAFQSFSRK